MANEQYEIYQQGTAAALAEVQLALLNSKASPDASYPSLSAGSATGITGDVETASWMARQTNADGAALIESVKGNTLRWNQLALNGNFASTAHWGAAYGSMTFSASDNELTIASTGAVAIGVASDVINLTNGHKYYFSLSAKGDSSLSLYASLNSASNTTNGVISNKALTSAYQRLSGIVTFATPSSGTNRIRISTPNNVTSGDSFVVKEVMLFDLTAMFGAGNEPSTVAEFEVLFPEPYYPYDAGSLLSVEIQGVETVGFNQIPDVWEKGYFNASGEKVSDTSGNNWCVAEYADVFQDTTYYVKLADGFTTSTSSIRVSFYDASKTFISRTENMYNQTFTTPSGARYFRVHAYFTTAQSSVPSGICINLSWSGYRNGEYEAYWSAQRAIAASTYFPNGMRSAGTVRDELTATEAITRVGSVDLGTLPWTYNSGYFYSSINGKAAGNHNLMCDRYETTSSVSAADMTDKQIKGHATTTSLYIKDSSFGTDGAALKASLSGVMLYYELATPTTTPIDPPLPMSYRTGAGGTERVMVAEGTMSAPPIFATRYPLDPADLAASIAPVDGPTATTNHQVGDLLMLGFTLCKATQVIVTGETIAIGTNVTRTTVAAELAALSE